MSRERWRSATGAVAAEQIAVLVVIAAVVAALLAIGMSERVRDTGVAAVRCLFGGPCELPDGGGSGPGTEPGPGTEDDDAPPVCTTSGDVWDRSRTTDWIFDRSVEGERYAVTRLADGSVVIVDTQYEGSGTVVGVGGQVPLGEDTRLGVSADGAGVSVEESGRMFVLTPEAFEAYRDTMADIIVSEYTRGGGLADLNDILTASPDEVGDVLHAQALRDMVFENLINEHATHDYYRTYDQITLNVGASVPIPKTPIVIGAGASGSGSSGTGVAVDRDTGAVTLTYELEAGAELSASVSAYVVGVTERAGLDGSYSVSVSVDPDGSITDVSLTTRVEVSGGTSAGLAAGGLGGTTRGSGRVSFADAGYLETTFSLPVGGSPDAQRDVQAFLEDPVGNAGDFLDVVGDHGTALVQGFEVAEDNEEVALALRVIASAGFSSTDSHRSFELVGAASYDPVNGLMLRSDCVS